MEKNMKTRISALALAGSILVSGMVYSFANKKNTNLTHLAQEQSSSIETQLNDEEIVNNYMKNELQQAIGSFQADLYSSIVKLFEEANYGSVEIAKIIANYDDLTWAGLHLTALIEGKKELADKIDEAMHIVQNQRIELIKEAIKNGTTEEVFQNMHWTSILDLKVKIELDAEFDRRELTEEEQILVEILDEAWEKGMNESKEHNYDSQKGMSI